MIRLATNFEMRPGQSEQMRMQSPNTFTNTFPLLSSSKKKFWNRVVSAYKGLLPSHPADRHVIVGKGHVGEERLAARDNQLFQLIDGGWTTTTATTTTTKTSTIDRRPSTCRTVLHTLHTYHAQSD
jgi:hypothetical protein